MLDLPATHSSVDRLPMSDPLPTAGDPYHVLSEALRVRGMRMTRQRERMLQALLAAPNPQSAEEIRVAAGFAPSDLVTVYRNLESFITLGLAQRILLENGTQLFEWVTPNAHHHHIICRQCHHTEPLEFCAADQLEARAAGSGFTELTHVIEVFGVCPDCRGDPPPPTPPTTPPYHHHPH
jgi:Fur family transcriptional regulator, ferric uptake regulator